MYLALILNPKYFPDVENRTHVIRARTEYPKHVDCKTSLEIKWKRKYKGPMAEPRKVEKQG
jgi:hypothetical protein